MKLSYVLIFGLIGCALAVPKTFKFDNECHQNLETGLGSFVHDFGALIPLEPVFDIILEYLSEDIDVQRIILYIQNETFHDIIETIGRDEDFIAVMEYLCVDLELNSYYYLNSLGDILGFPHVIRPNSTSSRIPDREPGVWGMIREMKKVLPMEEIKKFIHKSANENEALKLAIAEIKSDTFHRVADRVEAMDSFKDMCKDLESVGIDTVKVIYNMKKWLGWIE